jgi:hypothetical protein
MQALFGKKLTPKEQAMKAKRETKKEVRVSTLLLDRRTCITSLLLCLTDWLTDVLALSLLFILLE